MIGAEARSVENACVKETAACLDVSGNLQWRVGGSVILPNVEGMVFRLGGDVRFYDE